MNSDSELTPNVRRTLKAALLGVRVIVAIAFTIGGLSFAGVEAAYQQFGPFLIEMLDAQTAASQQPNNADLRLRSHLAEHYYELSGRGHRFAQRATLVMAFTLTGVGFAGVFVGGRLKSALHTLNEQQPVA